MPARPLIGPTLSRSLLGLRDNMKALRITIVLLACSFALASCDRSPSGSTPATSARQPEVTVSTVDGLEITQTFHREVDLGAFLKTLPSGSVDVLDTTDDQPHVIAVVEVKQAASAGQAPATTPHGFQTVFRGKGDTPVTKQWTPAAGNTSNTWRAVFVLPDSIEKGETRLISDRQPRAG